jgi:Bardet-Biedl syndrome 7 protein
VNTFKINYKIVRNSQDASYSIHIDSQYPIEIVSVQSLINVELMEVDSNIAILSTCPEDPDQKYALSATYRFVDTNASKFEIKIRTIEGQHGDLNCFVIPNAQPKTCQAFNIPLKPLSLHERHAVIYLYQ